jgi:hypothetical protein
MKLTSILLALLLVVGGASAQTITDIYMPRYIQGVGAFNPAAERRVPFACRVKVDGLLPNTTYFYYNTFIGVNESNFSQGEGTVVLVKDTGFKRIEVPSMSPGEHGEFITDAAGSYTGWFVTEPAISGNFIPGFDIFFHLLINDGAGGEYINTFLTSTSPVRVINFGADAASGTGLRATPLRKAAAKQFILLYDNLNASGRPIASTYVESDGTAGTLANGYAPFYADNVNGVDRAFGTIIPNTLPNGLLRMDVHALADGAFKRSYFPYPVIETWNPLTIGFRWLSTNNTLIDTRNPTGGLGSVFVIDGSKVLGINIWLSGEQTIEEDRITIQWASPADEEASEYVVERSTDAGKTFSPVRSIRKGTDKQIYELKDTRTETTSFYRVVMVGKDGARTTSEALKVQGVIKINVYPNPVTDQLLVQHPKAEAGAAVQVVGVDGRQVLTQNVPEGSVQTRVGVKNLVAGSYYLIYSVNGQRQSKSFIKK